MLDSFQLLPFDRETAVRHSRISRELRASGNRIGANDLWIAAVSLANELPLVTRNVVEFQRVPGYGSVNTDAGRRSAPITRALALGDRRGLTARDFVLSPQIQPGRRFRLRGSCGRAGLVLARTFGPKSPAT